jgi:hypothetical protein
MDNTAFDEKSIGELVPRLRGSVILPSNPEYDGARRVHNGMIDRRPAAIVRCVDPADVIATVNFARDRKRRLAVRCGGHNAAGLGVADDAVVADLAGLRGVRVDPESRTARVGGGCLLGEVDHATHAFGLGVTAGIISTTGVGGLTLGGGVGYLARKCGLTIDNLREVDMVLADGSFVTASERKNPDLFWAVRGGGGNFGIVTSFLFGLHPVSTVYAGPMLWRAENTVEMFTRYRELMAEHEKDDDFYGFFMVQGLPSAEPFPAELRGKTVCGVMWCHTGTPEQAEKALRPIRAARKPDLDWTGPLPYPAVQSMFDPFYPPGLQWYWKADFVGKLSNEAIEIHAKHGTKSPGPLCAMHMYPVDGAAARVGPAETAWSFREAKWVQVIVGIDPDPKSRDAITRWSKSYWEELHPHSLGGAYINMMMEEGEDRIRATYRGNYDRLASIKRKYDPANFFNVNQNIAPAGTARPS